ncbi:MAG: response regulator [Phenylobacterium sp.]
MSDLKPILVIESRPKDLEQTLAALARQGLANPILVARHGPEALDFLNAKGGAALVLLDLADSGGAELLAQVKAGWPRAPVLALVAAGHRARMAREHPTVPTLAKPLTGEGLLAAVQDLGQALAIVGQATPRGAYVPPGSRLEG